MKSVCKGVSSILAGWSYHFRKAADRSTKRKERGMEFSTKKFYTTDMTKLRYLRKINLEAYGYAIKAEHLMNSQS